MNEIKVWRKEYNGFADFYLEKRGVGKVRNIFFSIVGHWVIIHTPVPEGDRSDPLSFLVITGISVEEAWERGSEITPERIVIELK
jgi:hypothetical protein